MNVLRQDHVEADERSRTGLHGAFEPAQALAIDPCRAKMVALLRYRGMEREARLALQLANVEHLIRTVGAVFEGLDSIAEHETEAKNVGLAESVGDRWRTPEESEAAGIVPKQVMLVETVLDRALTRLRHATARTEADGVG